MGVVPGTPKEILVLGLNGLGRFGKRLSTAGTFGGVASTSLIPEPIPCSKNTCLAIQFFCTLCARGYKIVL